MFAHEQAEAMRQVHCEVPRRAVACKSLAMPGCQPVVHFGPANLSELSIPDVTCMIADIGDDLNDHEEGDEEASGSSSFDNECDALAKLSLGVPRQAGPSEDDVATTARDTSPGPLAQVAHAAADPESPCNPSAGYTKPGSLLWGGIHRQMQPSRLMVNPSTAAGKSSSAAPLAPGQPSVAGLQQPRQSILPSAVAGAVGSPAAAAALDSTSSAAVAASATAAQQVLSRLSSFVSSSWSPSQLLPQDLLGSLGAEPGVTGAAAYPAPHLQDVTQARTDHSQQTAPEETAGCSNEPDAPADTAGSCSSQGDAAAAGSGPSAAAAPSNAAGGAWNMAIPVVRGALQPTCVPGAPIWDGHIWHPAAAVQPLQAAAVPGADGLRHVPLHNAAAAAHRVGGSTRRLFGFGAAGALVAADTSGSVGAGKAGVYKLALAQAALPVVAGWPVGTLGFAAAAAIQPPVVQGPGALPYQHLQEARAAAAAASGLAWHAQQPDVFYGCGTHLVHELSEPMTSHGMVVGVGQELDRGACGRVCLATTPDGSIFPGIVVKVCHGLNGCFNDADSYNELFHLEKLHGQEGIVPVFGAGWLVPSSNCSPEVLAVLRTRPVWCVLLERMQAPLSAVIHRAGGFRILLALRVTRTVLGILKRLHEDLERAYAHR